MPKYISSLVLLTLLVLGGFVSACQEQPQSPATTASQADMGRAVFANKCIPCHGLNGQGVTAPAIIGASASLTTYNTGEGLFNFVSAYMPANAPGSLPQQDYLNVVSYLLTQNNFVPAGTTLSISQLRDIKLQFEITQEVGRHAVE